MHKVTKAFKVNFIGGTAAELFLRQNTNLLKQLPWLAKQNNKSSLSRRKSSSFRNVQGGNSARTHATYVTARPSGHSSFTDSTVCVGGDQGTRRFVIASDNRLELKPPSGTVKKTFKYGIF
jgi:hypothetical protein